MRLPALSRRTIFPVWSRGAAAGWFWSNLVLFSDPGLYEVYGGTQSYLASHLLRAVNGGAPPQVVARAVLFVIVPAVVLALLVALRPGWLRWPRERLGRQAHISELLEGVSCPRWLKGFVASVTVGTMGVLLVIVATVGRGAARALANDMVPSAAMVIPTVILILVAVPLSAGGALGLSVAISHTRGWVGAYGRALVTFMVIVSPVAVGSVLASAFRLPVTAGDQIVLPSLVGGGAILGGWIGLLLAAVSVCLPLSTVLLLAALSLRSIDDVAAARDLGAGRVRVLMTVEAPYFSTIAIASLCLQAGMLLTNIAPLVFVQPSGTQLVTPTLLTLVASGLSDEAFALASIAGLLTCCAMAGVIAVVRTTISSTDQRKRWRRQ